MTSKEIESLYDQEQFEAALKAAAAFLADDPADTTVLYLKARCLLELSMAPEDEQQADDLINKAYNAFSDVLAVNEHHREAREYRAYIASYSGFITGKDEAVLADFSRLMEKGDDTARLRYLQWRYTAHLRQDNSDAAIEDMKAVIDTAAKVYSNDQPLRNELVAKIYYTLGEVFLLNKDDVATALVNYRQAFDHAVYQRDYLPVAKLALENEDYTFAEKLLEVLPVVLDDVDDDFVSLLRQVQEIFEHNRELPVALMYCKATAAFPGIMLGENEQDVVLEQISLGKKMMQLYPEVEYFCNYAARAFFNVGQYAEAMPYLEKGIAIRPHPLTLARWCYARYKQDGIFPSAWPDSDYDFPHDWYEAGVICSQWEVTEEPAKQQLLLFRNYLYGKGIDLYKAYWFGNGGSAKAQQALHFAVCCNNYGISLYELKQYKEAIEIHTIGYNISPFWEQLDSRALAYQDAGQYEKAVEDWATLLTSYSDVLDFEHYVANHDRLMYAYVSEIRDDEKALYWYESFMKAYDNGLSAEIENLQAEAYKQVMYHLNRMKTARGLIEGDTDDLSLRIGLLEKHLEQHADDSDAYFNLMQLYFKNNQYEHCAGCATNRLSIGGLNEIPVVSRVKIYYFRAKACIKLGNYKQAMEDLLQCETLTNGDPQSTGEDFFRIYGYLAETALALEDNKTAIAYAAKSIDINIRNNWNWDEVTAGICFTLACALKNDGRKKEAMKQLKLIVENFPAYEKAAEKMKEWKSKWNFL